MKSLGKLRDFHLLKIFYVDVSNAALRKITLHVVACKILRRYVLTIVYLFTDYKGAIQSISVSNNKCHHDCAGTPSSLSD